MPPKKPAAAEAAPPAPAEPPAPVDPGPEVNLNRLRFQAAFKVFDPESTNSIVAEEVPTLLRYLNVFVSDSDWQNTILPELLNGEPAPYLSRERVEAKAVQLMEAHTYDPDAPAQLYAAWRALDKANVGWVELAKFKETMATTGGMAPGELDAFLRVLAPKAFHAINAGVEEAQRIYYADYIAMMTRFK